MSILTKIVFLFLISITLMFYLSEKTNSLTDEKIELLHKQKYIQASKEIFHYLIDDDTAGIELVHVSAKQIPGLITSGQIEDAKSIAGLYAWLDYRKSN